MILEAAAKNNQDQSKSWSRYSLIAALTIRALIITALVLIANDLSELGSSPVFVSACASLGIVAATFFARSRFTTLAICLGSALLSLLYSGTSSIVSYLGATLGNEPLYAYAITQHIDLYVAGFVFGFVSSVFFLRHKTTGTIEALIIGLVGVMLLAGHRNYHFEMPRAVNDFAWNLGIGNLAALIIIGSVLLALLMTYLALAAIPWPEYTRSHNSVTGVSKQRLKFHLLAIALLFAGGIFYGVGLVLHVQYLPEAISRTANGVGQSTKEGSSPLGFHSALGGTNQPAALVRLEGDYKENPFTPMLYLREMALSEMSNNEIVQASSSYDTDLGRIKPGEPFTGTADTELSERIPVNQSVFLLADHQQAFALDYPLSIVRLKNPNPSRFKTAYRVYSMAPAYKPGSLNELGVGDPRWTEETKKHYLVTHSDPRYGDLAKELTKGLSLPIQQATAITDYLTKTAIYTLTPNHDVKAGDDPVAPFLFGDHRGYCVHFAHAIVYMLRSLGIPSRIGTGYLTDLSQAKDGHILLRMADRHAWAEIYVTGRGWIPFDIQPQQVESHGDLQVDMKLLEELMGMVDPGEEILPNDTIKNEANVKEPGLWQAPDLWLMLDVLLAAFLLGFFAKLFLRYGWILAIKPERRLRLSYIAVVSTLQDLGLPRNFAETRNEFGHRAFSLSKPSPQELTKLLLQIAYANVPRPLSNVAVDSARQADLAMIGKQSLSIRLLAFLNPASLLSLIGRGGW